MFTSNQTIYRLRVIKLKSENTYAQSELREIYTIHCVTELNEY